jgi:hypothetical protein
MIPMSRNFGCFQVLENILGELNYKCASFAIRKQFKLDSFQFKATLLLKVR